MSIFTTTTIAGVAAGLALMGGFAALAPATGPGSPAPAATATATAQPVDAATSADLLMAYEEERLARDLYRLFADTYGGARPFSAIAAAEQQHLSAVGALLVRHGLAVPPADSPAGTYGSPELQRLFDAWKQQGLTSLQEAHKVGVALETRDIADLEVVIARTTQTDVKAVLEHLQAGSRHHLRAFEAAVAGTTPAGPMGPSGAGRPSTAPGTGADGGPRGGAGTPQGDADGDGICDVTGLPVGSGAASQQGGPSDAAGPRQGRMPRANR